MKESPEENTSTSDVSASEVEPQMTKRLIVSIRDKRESLILLVIASLATILSCAYYLSIMLASTNPGFTLDDSWIHLQFARTIYEGTPWEYSPGFPSTGSTSPLWSLTISPLFFISQDPVVLAWGVYVISISFYIASSFMVGHIVRTYTESTIWGITAIIGFVLVPRNTWLMLSGMETPLFVFILLLSIIVLDRSEMKYDLVLGVLVGFAYLSRPEGLVIALCVPVRFLILGFKRELTRRRVLTLFVSGCLAILVAAPWILHCLSITGHPLPDTFYAKVHPPTEGEIAAWDFWWTLFVDQMPFLVIGAFVGIILLVKGKPFPWLIPVILTVMYRLTTPYASLINNNRYLVPVFNLFFIVTIIVSAWILQIVLVRVFRFQDCSETKFIAAFLVIGILVAPLVPHYDGQAIYYGKAVHTVNYLHVDIGIWIAENTPEDAIFATHDAGAVRFISNRSMIDLAGLVSPDIIHGNMSMRETLSYLREKGCNYFVYFDELFYYWTLYLTYSAYERVYTVTVPPEIHVGGGRPTMSVYQIHWENTDY